MPGKVNRPQGRADKTTATKSEFAPESVLHAPNEPLVVERHIQYGPDRLRSLVGRFFGSEIEERIHDIMMADHRQQYSGEEVYNLLCIKGRVSPLKVDLQ